MFVRGGPTHTTLVAGLHPHHHQYRDKHTRFYFLLTARSPASQSTRYGSCAVPRPRYVLTYWPPSVLSRGPLRMRASGAAGEMTGSSERNLVSGIPNPASLSLLLAGAPDTAMDVDVRGSVGAMVADRLRMYLSSSARWPSLASFLTSTFVASFAPFMAAVTVTVEDAAEFPWLALMYTVVGCGGVVCVDEGM